MANERILFVDDEAHIRKLVSTYLEKRGYEVTLANDGLEALKLIHQAPPDLVITDVNMPGIDGMELVRRVRQSPRTARIPLLMLSARRQNEDILRGYEAGADEYVPKPIELTLLVAKVETLLRRRPQAGTTEVALDRPRGRVVTFVHGKGGVGTTTLAVNVAVALATNSFLRVGLLDLNLQFGNASLMLDMHPRGSLADIASLPSAETADFAQFLETHSSGVRVLPGSLSPEMAELVSVASVKTALEYMRAQCDFVLVDTAPSFTDVSLAALDETDCVCVVSAPHLAALRATADLLAVLDRLQLKAARLVVLNRRTSGGIENAQAATFLKVALDMVIPYTEHFDRAADMGRPLVMTTPGNASAVAVIELSGKVAGPVAVAV
ncbi:MAG: response regulator [Candidatus Limnocylindria bacterium]